MTEAWELIKLTIPIFISMCSWVTMKVTDTAVLGHVGTRYLDATALSDIWTSSTGVFIQSRVVGTFCGQAFGAGNKMMVGIWLQVAYAVLATIMIPVAICWCLTYTVLRTTGNEEQISSDASYYALVLALCLPVRIAFSQLSSFLTSQKIMRPGVVCSVMSMLLNLFGNLVLVLGLPFPGWSGLGFAGCPWVTTVVEFIQLFVMWYVFCHLQKLHVDCWPGWSRKHITGERLKTYFKMYLPAALSIGSDFWRVAAIGAVAESLGKDNLGVFNASYRICWMMLTFMGALAGAVGTQLNINLGKGSPAAARRSAAVGTSIAVVLLVVLGLLIVFIPRQLGMIFSSDPAVLDLFEESRWPFAAFAVFMNLSVNLERIPMAAGRVNAVFYAGLVGSWVGQVPGVLLLTKFWRADLVGLYSGVAAGYALLASIFVVIILRLDWSELAHEARVRSEATKPKESMKMSLQPVATSTEEEAEDGAGASA